MFEWTISTGPAGFTSIVMRNSSCYATHEGNGESVEVLASKETGDGWWLPLAIVAVFLLAAIGMFLVSLWEKK